MIASAPGLIESRCEIRANSFGASVHCDVSLVTFAVMAAAATSMPTIATKAGFTKNIVKRLVLGFLFPKPKVASSSLARIATVNRLPYGAPYPVDGSERRSPTALGL